MSTIIQSLELTQEQKEAEIDKWSEGGVYRTALHTAMGLLATGTIEGTLSTGAVAGIAPKLNDIQAELTEKLTEQDFEKDTTESVSNSALTLAIIGAGTSTGLNTSSTAYAVNTDVNNRQCIHLKRSWQNLSLKEPNVLMAMNIL